LIALLEGLPAGLRLNLDAVRAGLKRRWEGHGRGPRAKFEQDALEVLSGLKRGVTLGTPLALRIGNSDARIDELPNLKAPRPGHADLSGMLRLRTRDARAILERASARETTARTALGEVARQLLAAFGIHVTSRIVSVGGVDARDEAAWRAAIDRAREAGDSLGGIFEVTATGCPPGLGGCAQPVDRLDARLMGALASIPAVKGVEIGIGFAVGGLPGTEVHDPIHPDPSGWAGLGRASNRSGGIEGGFTTGQPIVLRAALKPIPTLRHGVPSVDLATLEAARATYERSDVCVIQPAAVVGEAILCLELADALLARTGGVSMAEMRRRYADLGRTDDPRAWPDDVAGLG
jgi:chorismate synthase